GDADDVEVAGEEAGRQGAVGQDTVGPLPVGPAEVLLVLDEVAEAVADGPRPADQFADAGLPPQAPQPAGVVGGQRVVVPADGPADLHAVGVEPPGGVVRGGRPPRDPVGQPAQLAQPGGQRPGAGAGLALQLHQVQLGDAAGGPQVGGQADLRQGAAGGVEGQALDGAGGEVPA